MARRTTAPDFREAAVAASVDALAAHSGVDPMNAGVSYCLPALEDKRSALRAFKIGMILRLVFGGAGLVGGGVIAAFLDRPRFAQVPEWLAMTIAMCCTLGGMLILLSAAVGQKRFLRKHLGERFDAVVAIPSPHKPVAVGVEDAATFSKLKAAPEDLCIAVFDVQNRRLIMEGLSHSYVVHARDVLAIQDIIGGASIGTLITYNCGGEDFSMVLSQENIPHEIRRQTIGVRHGPLYKRIYETLTPAPGEAINLAADR